MLKNVNDSGSFCREIAAPVHVGSALYSTIAFNWIPRLYNIIGSDRVDELFDRFK